jgi:hypothetical protein
MRTRPVAVALLLAFAPAVVAMPSRAQTAAEDPMTDMARARFKEGVSFYDKGQFEQARIAFLQAYALKKHPAVLLNLAWSCLKSGHTLEAQRYFKQFLVEGKDSTDKQRADANDGLTQSNAKLGRIDVVAAPGTEVTVDGDKAGTTPLADPVMVEPGAHTVKFKGPDGATDTDSVTVLAGEKAIARFAKTASAAPAATAPAPPPAPSGGDTENPSSSPPPPEDEPKPVDTAPKENTGETSHGTIFVPKNLVPVFIAVPVAVAGGVLAIVMGVSKHNAQTKADETQTQILNAGGKSCNPPTPSSLSGLAAACDRFVSNNNDVNTDATVANFALGVAGVAAVAGLVYWLASTKREASSSAAHGPVLTPVIGPSIGGLDLSGSF